MILVGETRPETVETALNAAETGHLVFATLHTIDCVETNQPDRGLLPVRSAAPGPPQPRRVAEGHALPTAHPDGRRLRQGACARDHDHQRPNPAVHHRARARRDITAIIREGEYYGMQTFDQALVSLLEQGTIDLRAATQAASNPHDLRVAPERRGLIGSAAGR